MEDARKKALVSRTEEELKCFHQFYEESHLYASHALSLEEEGDAKAALVLYEQALRLIDQALSIVNEGERKTGEDRWDEVKNKQDKLRKIRLQILERLTIIGSVQVPQAPMSDLLEPPPSYEESTSTSTSTSTHPRWFCVNDNEVTTSGVKSAAETNGQSLQSKVSGMNAALGEIDVTTDEVPENAEQIFSLPEVQIFFVSPEGHVSAPSYPTALILYKFIDEKVLKSKSSPTSTSSSSNSETSLSSTSPVQASGWLQVGQWVYPLIPGRSPVLQTSYGAYMFPDTSLRQPGAAIGLLLPDSLDEDVRLIFEQLLCELTAIRLEGTTITLEEVLAQEKRLSEKISAGIIKSAEFLAKGVGYGAEITKKLVHQGARKLQERINPSHAPKDVDPRVQKGIKIARDVTGVAVCVSSFIVRRVGEATLALGRFVAPHIRRHGSLLLSKALGKDQATVNHQMDDVLEVAAGGMKGFATIYVSLESAARLLASSLANETVHIVHYRFGNAVGDVTDNAVRTVGNVALTAYNINAMGVKGIAKRTAKSTGKALVEEFEQRSQKNTATTSTKTVATVNPPPPFADGKISPPFEKKDLSKF